MSQTNRIYIEILNKIWEIENPSEEICNALSVLIDNIIFEGKVVHGLSDREYGQLIRKARESRKPRPMTQFELAKKIGVEQPYISQVERGKKDLTQVRIDKIEAVLKLPKGYLSPSKKRNLVREDGTRSESRNRANGTDVPPIYRSTLKWYDSRNGGPYGTKGLQT